MAFTLPELPYPYDALTPYMSRETLEFHHDKHHQAYVTAGNNLAKGTEWENKPLEEIVKGTFGKNQGLFNNAGQHYNHIHFWQWMKKGGGGEKLPGKLEKQLTSDVGPLAKVKEELTQAGVTQFGSGWCWLAVKDGKIVVMKTPNGENPLVHGAKPILGCDVWEHSYYIDYRNRRPDYLKAFLDHLVNWDHVAEMYEAAMKYPQSATPRAKSGALWPRFLQCTASRSAYLTHCFRYDCRSWIKESWAELLAQA
jgi:Fe-Mn family superoxide dismutase